MATKFTDQQLTCEDCSSSFTWTAGEQEFYDSRGFTPPKRCKPCRERNKDKKHEHNRVTRTGREKN
jgi:hypothetical protein